MNRNFFFNILHASQYLRGSVIRLDNQPIYVQDMVPRREAADRGKDFDMEYLYLGERKRRLVKISDEKINYNPVPLGFVNYRCRGSGAMYSVFCSRMPVRNWKVGLCRQNFTAQEVVPSSELRGVGADRGYLLISKELKRTIKNNFPGFEECLTTMGENTNNCFSISFSKRFALLSNSALHYKNFDMPVGKWDENGPALYDEYQYLDQVLKEDLH